MITRFDGVPDPFVVKYEPELQEWARMFRRWGSRCYVPLRGRTVGVPEVDGLGEVPWVVVTLVAELRGGVMVVRPGDVQSADLIERHVAAMRH